MQSQISRYKQYIQEKMQEEFSKLPKRNGNGTLKNAKSMTFQTNFHEVKLKELSGMIYLYDIRLEDEIPQISQFYHKAVLAIKEQLQKEIGYLTHRGQLIWGKKTCQKAMTFQTKILVHSQEKVFQAIVSQRRAMNLMDINTSEYRAPVLQMLNTQLKESLIKNGMHQLGKNGKYFDLSKQINLDEEGLIVAQGYEFTLVPLDMGITLRIDLCSRILQKQTLLENYNQFSKKTSENMNRYIGQSVITRYGKNFKIYKIEDVDFMQTPKDTFFNKKSGKEESYVDFYMNKYGAKVKDLKQPLLKVIVAKNKVKKQGKTETVIEYGYLLPELVSLTGLSSEQKSDFHLQKKLNSFVVFPPEQRVKRASELIKKLNQTENSLIEIGKIIEMDGYQLNAPTLKYRQEITAQNGLVKHYGPLKEACNFGQDWYFIHPYQKSHDAEKFFELLEKAGHTFGIRLDEPKFFEVKGRIVEQWTQQISEILKKYGTPKIIVVLFSNKDEEKFYGKLKQYLNNEAKCISQIILRKTLSNPKSAMSVASKICIQMSAKASCAPWSVTVKHNYFSKKNVMSGGISFSKRGKGYTFGFVGAINNESTRFHSYCKTGIRNRDDVKEELYEQVFIEWAKNYFQNNNRKVPDTIIIYQEGQNELQAEKHLRERQQPALENMIKKIEKATKTSNYNPEIIIVLVNKLVSNRFFTKNGRIANPNSGSIIVDKMSCDQASEFYLVPHNVGVGTCTPTSFKIAFDNSKVPQEALIEYTYNHCFNYYNFSGGVRVPGCLKNAQKLAKLVGEHMKEDLVQSNMTNQPFFY